MDPPERDGLVNRPWEILNQSESLNLSREREGEREKEKGDERESIKGFALLSSSVDFY